jgi:hypothetical protein
MELAELSFPFETRLRLRRFLSRKAVVLKIHLVRELKVTGLRFLNRRRLTRRPPTAVVNCGLPVTAVHAGLLTYIIYTRNGFREITNACPSPTVLALTTSENVTACITFASVRRQYQWHQNGTWDFLPASHPMRCIMTGNGVNVWLRPGVRHGLTWSRDTTQRRCNLLESESLFKEEIIGELRLAWASSQSVIPCPVGKLEGMCKLLPRTMQDFALTISRAFSRVVLVRTKCFRKFGGVGSHWPLLAPTSGP